jgi:CHAD domain-containing protein
VSYGISFDEPSADAVERVRREQLQAAAEALEAPEDPVEAVHDARKRIKKTRALLRLARPALKDKAYRRHNAALRDAGRGLSAARDADVLQETLQGLQQRFVGQYPEAFFALPDADAGGADEGEAATDTTAHAGAFRALAHEAWTLRDLSPDDLVDAYTRTYARGREAFERADRRPTVTNLHDWRKRVKDLWYQERLLADTWPGVMKAQAKEAKALSELLGDDHDLAVLAERVQDAELLELIARRRAELLDEARALGRRIYAEAPKAFARRARRYVELAAA